MDNAFTPTTRFLLAAGRTLAAILLTAALVTALLTTAVGIVFDRDRYVEAAANEGFLNTLYADVQNVLKSECEEQRQLPYEPFRDTVTKPMIHKAVSDRLASIYDRMSGEGELRAVVLDPAPLAAALDRYFDGLPAEEQAELSPDVAKQVAEEITTTLEWVLVSGVSDRLVTTVSPLFTATAKLRRLSAWAVWLWVAVAVLIAVNMIPYGSRWRKRAHVTAGALFLGSAAVAIPAWLIVDHDLPSRLIFREGDALPQYIRTLLYDVSGRIHLLVTVAFAVTAVLLVAAIVWNVWPDKPAEKTSVGSL